jgi:HSP20 family protein
MITLRERMNRLFEDFFASRGEEQDLLAGSWTPSVDIYETEHEVVLTAELPGMDEKDIDIKVEDNTLTISGERRLEKEIKEENYHRIERAYGSFCRSFTLPNYVDQDKISAEYDNGILKITMPKKPELKPRKVKVLKASKKEAKKK